MVSMGVVGNKDEFGIEGSVLIRRVGSAVKDLQVGDRVIVLDLGLLRTRTVTSARRCLKIPENLSLEDAAAMPSVYATAIHSLINHVVR